jgi:hypothetical protein
MSRIVWKDGGFLSVETRKGVYVLAQMARSPYLVFFNAFSTDGKWEHVDPDRTPVLFSYAVTRQFLQLSHIEKLLISAGKRTVRLPARWIHSDHESRRVTVWPGTPREKTFIWLNSGGHLVEKNIETHRGGPYKHHSGVFDKLLKNVRDPALVRDTEFDSLAVFPSTNERLYLCYRMGRNVDPDKYISFGWPLLDEFETYIRICAAGGNKREQDKLLKLYR